MRSEIKLKLADALSVTGVLPLLRKLSPATGGLILALHRVLPRDEKYLSYDEHMVLAQTAFEDLLIHLRQHYEPVSLDTMFHTPRSESKRQRVALTFDDGWTDTFGYAYPLLLRYEVPATVFVCTSLLGTSQLLPEERISRIYQFCVARKCTNLLESDLANWGVPHASAHGYTNVKQFLKQMPLITKLTLISHLEAAYGVTRDGVTRFMNWEEIEVMTRGGIQFGSHTANHATLTGEQQSVMVQELCSSRDVLELHTGVAPRYLSYPNGKYNELVMQLAAEAGYTHGLTTKHGFYNPSRSSLAIPRIAIDDTIVTDTNDRLHAGRTSLHFSRLWNTYQALTSQLRRL